MLDSYKRDSAVIGFAFNTKGFMADLSYNIDRLTQIEKP